MPISPIRTTGAAIAALCIVAAARRARVLSPSGAAAAWAVGTMTVAGGGWTAGGALVAFFASANALSLLGRRRGPAAQERGNERDAVQVAANGGFAMLAALGMAVGNRPGAARSALFGSLAAAAADTWATETGRWSVNGPRRLLLGPPVAPGTSGGMTPLGTIGSIAGAAAIAIVAATDPVRAERERGRAFLATLVAGIAGALADSVLGATLQGVRVCPACGRETELRSHCGAATLHARGCRWLDNDGVNAAATTVGGLVSAGLGRDRQGRRVRSSR